MKKKGFIMAAVISCLLLVSGAGAGTVGYSDSTQNGTTTYGVVGRLVLRHNRPWVCHLRQCHGSHRGYPRRLLPELEQRRHRRHGPRHISLRDHLRRLGSRATATSVPESSPTALRATGGRFRSDSQIGKGVEGNAAATAGVNFGGYFKSASSSGTGVWGRGFVGLSGIAMAESFRSDSTLGTGVVGWAIAGTGNTYGGYFLNYSTSGNRSPGLGPGDFRHYLRRLL